MHGRKPNTLSTQQKRDALKYLMFLKEKRNGIIKGRGCADRRKQRVYKTKEETSAPTVSTPAFFLSCLIDATERRRVLTCDIPGAFMQGDIDEFLLLKLEGPLAQQLINIEPTYAKFVTYKKRK